MIDYSRIRRSTFLKGVTVLASGTAAGQLISLLISPILTRIYSPEDIGLLGLFLSLASIFSVFVTLKYESAIVGANSDVEAKSLLRLCVLITPVTLVLIASFLFILRTMKVLGVEKLSVEAMLLLVPFLLFLGVRQAIRFFLVRTGAFSVISKQVVIQGIMKGASQLFLSLISVSVISLIAGEVLGILVALFYMFFSNRAVFFDNDVSTSHLCMVAKKYREFPLFSVPSGVSSSLSTNLRIPLVLELFGAAVGGYFALVFRVISGPTALIRSAVGDSFHSRVTSYRDNDSKSVVPLFAKTTLGLSFVGIGPFAALFFFGAEIFSLVFGEAWRDAGIVASALAPLGYVQFVVSPMSRALDVFNGQKQKFFFHILSLMVLVVVFLIARENNWILDQFLSGLVYLSVCLYVSYLAAIYVTIIRYLNSTD